LITLFRGQSKGKPEQVLKSSGEYEMMAGKQAAGPQMDQISFTDAEFTTKKRKTRREKFLDEMERAVPWKELEAVIEHHYPQSRQWPTALPTLEHAANPCNAALV